MIVRLRTEGMRCHSCEQVLSAWVRDIPGVEAVVADHEIGLVTIFASDDASVDDMLKAVMNAGFVPGVPEVVESVSGAPSVEMPIAASKTDPPEVPVPEVAAPVQAEVPVVVAAVQPIVELLEPSPSPSPNPSPSPTPTEPEPRARARARARTRAGARAGTRARGAGGSRPGGNRRCAGAERSAKHGRRTGRGTHALSPTAASRARHALRRMREARHDADRPDRRSRRRNR